MDKLLDKVASKYLQKNLYKKIYYKKSNQLYIYFSVVLAVHSKPTWKCVFDVNFSLWISSWGINVYGHNLIIIFNFQKLIEKSTIVKMQKT